MMPVAVAIFTGLIFAATLGPELGAIAGVIMYVIYVFVRRYEQQRRHIAELEAQLGGGDDKNTSDDA